MIVNAHSRNADISMKRAKVHLQGETCVEKSKIAAERPRKIKPTRLPGSPLERMYSCQCIAKLANATYRLVRGHAC
jgi:hypothetical protein